MSIPPGELLIDFSALSAALDALVTAHGLRLPAILREPASRDRYLSACLQVRPRRDAGPAPSETYRMMGSYVAGATTIAEVVTRLHQFGELLGNTDAVVLDATNASVALDAIPFVDKVDSAYRTLLPTLYVVQLYHFLGWLANHSLRIRRLELQTEAPRDTAIYRQLFAAEILFARPRNVFHFCEGELERPQVRDHSQVTQLFNRWHGMIWMVPLHEQRLAERVLRLLMAGFNANSANLSAVALALQLAPTTLRNRLRKEGTSFQKLKDECRMKLAKDYLVNSELPIEEISALLGYSEVSNFYQAFKRNLDRTPASFRQK
ncbi:MAG TPA: helix-turn-helix domain-containing protein [Spongiibacteraceae bacterium]|nr:helix-turn-helix domain-containing protein [Spongiibacteraceae bacterium]